MLTFSRLGQMGRLGNQLFQIAATISHAKKMGVQSRFPKWEYKDCFENPITDGLAFNDIKDLPTYSEPFFHYQEIPKLLNGDLKGYFQSHKYFHEQLIRETFPFSEKVINLMYEKYKDLFLIKGTYCSIHVRRGDYVKPPQSEYHKELGSKYYMEAINEMAFRTKTTHLLVFSDDIEYCKGWLFNTKNDQFTFIEGNSDIEDLYLQSVCQHNIIANSSFSWWGAWLNRNPNKVVVAPKDWFIGEGLKNDTKDLMPKEWIQI